MGATSPTTGSPRNLASTSVEGPRNQSQHVSMLRSGVNRLEEVSEMSFDPLAALRGQGRPLPASSVERMGAAYHRDEDKKNALTASKRSYYL